MRSSREIIKIVRSLVCGVGAVRGEKYAKKGDHDQEIADFTQAIRIDSDFVLNYFEHGDAYVAKGDYDRAIADYTQASSIDSGYAALKDRLEAARKRGEKK